jgi:hypothetical protein
MIIDMIFDIRYFIFIYLIAVVGFANGMYLLAINDGGSDTSKYFTGENMFQAIAYSYKIGLGDFDTGDFATEDITLIYMLWILNTLFIMIILLNLLIAIMGDTFDRVKETAENTMLQELT